MKKQAFRIVLMLIIPGLITFLVSGCLNNEWADKEQHEKDVIQKYLTDHGITANEKTQSGLYYVEEVSGTGLQPEKDDYVVINYTGTYLESGIIHETTYDSLKSEWPQASYYTHYVYGPVKFQYGYSIAGINEGLGLMKEGGKANLVIPSDLAFYDFNPLAYEIQLLKVIKDPGAYEDSMINIYLPQVGFDTVMTHHKGIYFKETLTPNPSDPHNLQSGDTLYFRFTGRLVDTYNSPITDNRVFDSNMNDDQPAVYIYGRTSIESGNMLSLPSGLITALDSLRSGTHATAILPYQYAFTDRGLFSSVYGYTIVPKYETVAYDIIAESIHKASK